MAFDRHVIYTMFALIPVNNFRTGFTTSSIELPNLIHVPLDDKLLGIHKSTVKLTHPVVVPPTPISLDPILPPPPLAWEANYPKGSINPKGSPPGGFGFYLSGPPTFAESVSHANEVVFSYRMMLEPDWEWVRGGKLPGICGPVFFFD